MCNYTETTDILIEHARQRAIHIHCISPEKVRTALIKIADIKLPCGHDLDSLIPMENGMYYCDVCSVSVGVEAPAQEVG